MPIPFHEVGAADELGPAGFLKLEALVTHDARTAGAWAGLLVINPRGEPLEFVFNRVELPHPFLWGERLARCHLERRLVTSLLSVCSHDPRLLVCLAEEIDADLFGRELRIDVPVVRLEIVSPGGRVVDKATGEVLDEQQPGVSVDWQPSQPEAVSSEYRLFEWLTAHHLLLEPFERASIGLREVYAGDQLQKDW